LGSFRQPVRCREIGRGIDFLAKSLNARAEAVNAVSPALNGGIG
jgi:hypothetical protein